ncbi:IS66 family transposase [Phocaeicola sartorii]|nr:IS66 family transposase [Phocaeicola sartorii]MCR1845809.1 IS66 family transposase [Phocaeicola sartorii]
MCPLNQWDSLRNFILDSKAEKSNNLVEQRMKPIKLDLKKSQNIRSGRCVKTTAHLLFIAVKTSSMIYDITYKLKIKSDFSQI